eukprot:INCI4134.2.p1 GENE.INCI4134.2~~INCI4134.2.p1  ORF type:complete len:2546 (-),score=426.11 INCI4134.2:1528-9165(-)
MPTNEGAKVWEAAASSAPSSSKGHGLNTQMLLGKAMLSLNDPSNEVVMQGLVFFLKEATRRQRSSGEATDGGSHSNDFVRAYYSSSPKFLELFNALDKPTFNSGGQDTINIVKIFAALLTDVPDALTSLAISASKRLLSSKYIGILTAAFGSTSRVGLACATMQLLTQMAKLGHKSLVRQITNAFNFTLKSFLHLGHAGGVGARRKSKRHTTADAAVKKKVPKSRTLFVELVVALLSAGAPEVQRSLLVPRGPMAVVLEHVDHDVDFVARQLVHALRVHFVGNHRLGQRLRLQTFTHDVMARLQAMLSSHRDAKSNQKRLLRQDLESLFCDLLVNPSTSWFISHPSQSGSSASAKNVQRYSSQNNHRLDQFLSRVLMRLDVTRDPVQRGFLLETLRMRPERIGDFLSHWRLSLDPRLSVSWIMHVNIYIEILAIPIEEPTLLFAIGALLRKKQAQRHGGSRALSTVGQDNDATQSAAFGDDLRDGSSSRKDLGLTQGFAKFLQSCLLCHGLDRSVGSNGLRSSQPPVVQFLTAAMICAVLQRFEAITTVVKSSAAIRALVDPQLVVSKLQGVVFGAMPSLQVLVAKVLGLLQETQSVHSDGLVAKQRSRNQQLQALSLCERILRILCAWSVQLQQSFADLRLDFGKLICDAASATPTKSSTLGATKVDINNQPIAIQHAILDLILRVGADRCQWMPAKRKKAANGETDASRVDPLQSIVLLFSTTKNALIRQMSLEVLVRATMTTTGVVCCPLDSFQNRDSAAANISFDRDVLAATSNDPLSLITTLLLVPAKHIDECATFIADFLHHMQQAVHSEIEYFQRVGNQDGGRIHAHCSLLFIASLRYMQIHGEAHPTPAAFLFVVWDRFLRSKAAAGEHDLCAELGAHFLEMSASKARSTPLLSKLAKRALFCSGRPGKSGHGEVFPPEVTALWHAAADVHSENTPSSKLVLHQPEHVVAALRALPPEAFVGAHAALEDNVPPDVWWLHRQRGSRRECVPGGWKLQFLALALVHIGHSPMVDDMTEYNASVSIALKLVQRLLHTMLEVAASAGTGTDSLVKFAVESINQYLSSPHAARVFAEAFQQHDDSPVNGTELGGASKRVRKLSKPSLVRAFGAHATLPQKALCLFLLDFVASRPGSPWGALNGAIKTHFVDEGALGSPSTSTNVAQILAFMRVWKLTPFLNAAQKLKAIKQTVTCCTTHLHHLRSGSQNTSTPAPILAALALCENIVLSLDLEDASVEPDGAIASHQSVQAIYARLATMLTSIGAARALDGKWDLFVTSCRFIGTLLQPRRRPQTPSATLAGPNVHHTLRQNVQGCLTKQFVQSVVDTALAPGDAPNEARIEACALVAALLQFPSLWQRHLRHVLACTTFEPLKNVPSSCAKFKDELSALLTLMLALLSTESVGTGTPPGPFFASIDAAFGESVILAASSTALSLPCEVAGMARSVCALLATEAARIRFHATDQKLASAAQVFLDKLHAASSTKTDEPSSSVSSDTKIPSVRFSLLPQLRPLVIGTEEDVQIRLSRLSAAGFSSLGAAVKLCLENLLLSFKPQRWKHCFDARVVAAVEDELWNLLYELLQDQARAIAKHSTAGNINAIADLAEAVGPDVVKQFIARGLRRRYNYRCRCQSTGSFLSCVEVIRQLCAVGGVARRDFKDVVTLIVSHPSFVETLRDSGETPCNTVLDVAEDAILADTASSDMSLIEVLRFLLPQCPSLLKQRSRLVYIFLAAYRASMSHRDMLLLDLIELFEANKCQCTAASLGFRWGAAALAVEQDIDSTGAQGMGASEAALDSEWFFVPGGSEKLDDDLSVEHLMNSEGLDAGRLFWSLYSFPLHRLCPAVLGERDDDGAVAPPVDTTDRNDEHRRSVDARVVYDPRFLLRLVLHYAQCTTLPLRHFFRNGCFAFVLFAAASDRQGTRQVAYEILALVADQLEGAKFAEVMQLRHLVLGLLRRSIPKPHQKLPGIICSFLAEACQILLDPAANLYGDLNQFLLARPHLDLGDVPMFYSCFQAATPDAREMRRWHLKLLIIGVKSSQDIALLERRHVVPLVLGFHDSILASPRDRAYCVKFLRTLAELRSPACQNHLASCGVLTWLAKTCAQSEEIEEFTNLISIATSLVEQKAGDEDASHEGVGGEVPDQHNAEPDDGRTVVAAAEAPMPSGLGSSDDAAAAPGSRAGGDIFRHRSAALDLELWQLGELCMRRCLEFATRTSADDNQSDRCGFIVATLRFLAEARCAAPHSVQGAPKKNEAVQNAWDLELLSSFSYLAVERCTHHSATRTLLLTLIEAAGCSLSSYRPLPSTQPQFEVQPACHYESSGADELLVFTLRLLLSEGLETLRCDAVCSALNTCRALLVAALDSAKASPQTSPLQSLPPRIVSQTTSLLLEAYYQLRSVSQLEVSSESQFKVFSAINNLASAAILPLKQLSEQNENDCDGTGRVRGIQLHAKLLNLFLSAMQSKTPPGSIAAESATTHMCSAAAEAFNLMLSDHGESAAAPRRTRSSADGKRSGSTPATGKKQRKKDKHKKASSTSKPKKRKAGTK